MTSKPASDGRRVVVTTFVTLDGYMVGPDEDISWVIDSFDDAMQEDIAVAMSSEFDYFVFGRVTFEIFEEYWPHAVPYDTGDALSPSAGKEDPRIIKALNELPKLVFSTTLKQTDWQNSQIFDHGLEDEIRKLKAEPGKAINVQGSASIVQALQRADLVDEYRLLVHPVLLGAGTPLFSASGLDRQDLVLAESEIYPNGVIAVTYRRKGAA